MSSIVYIGAIALIALGLYAILFKRNLIKIVIGVSLIEAGANLLFVTLGYVEGGTAPIFTLAPTTKMVLPMPQAAVLTSIVIGVAITALMLSFAMNYYQKYGTLDASKGRLRG